MQNGLLLRPQDWWKSTHAIRMGLTPDHASNPACAVQALMMQADAEANKSQHEVSGQSADSA
jgi:hypothetical protein